MNLRILLPVALAVTAIPVAGFSQAPCSIPFQSYLTDVDGVARDTPIDIQVTFYDGAAGSAAAIDCRVFSDVPVDDGWLNLTIDACNLPAPDPSGCGVMTVTEILDAGATLDAQVFMGLRLGDDAFDAGPRTPVGAVPYAVYARTAESVDGFDPDDYALLTDLSALAGSGHWLDVLGVPEGLDDGDQDTLGALICTEGQVPVYDEDIDGWVCGAGGGGGTIEIGGELLTVGTRGAGTPYASLDTPLGIPDGIVTGITSARFIVEDTQVETISLDLVVDHPDPSQLTVTLTSPEGTAITIVDGPTTTLTEINGNFGWDFEIEGGDRYSFHEESIAGVWILQVVDSTAGSSGSLESWELRVNEGWSGRAFIGGEIETPGQILANEIVVTNGGRMVFRNTDGTDVFELTAGTASDTSRIRVSSSLMVDEDARPSETWWNANATCISAGGYMCSTGMLSGMCTNGVISLSAGAHWTDQRGNGRNTGQTIGSGCTSTTMTGATSSRVFRCCYTF